MKVLIVDDDRSSRTILKGLLVRSFECTVMEAETGGQALEIYEAHGPDVVCLDMILPDMDGLEVLRALRKADDGFAARVIGISGVRDRQVIDDLISLGVSDYLLKPLNFEQARKRLERVLSEESIPSRAGTDEEG